MKIRSAVLAVFATVAATLESAAEVQPPTTRFCPVEATVFATTPAAKNFHTIKFGENAIYTIVFTPRATPVVPSSPLSDCDTDHADFLPAMTAGRPVTKFLMASIFRLEDVNAGSGPFGPTLGVQAAKRRWLASTPVAIAVFKETTLNVWSFDDRYEKEVHEMVGRLTSDEEIPEFEEMNIPELFPKNIIG